MSDDPPNPFVSRGGLKLRHALDTFNIDPAGLRCADFGANVGGFTDCLLQAGAAHVTAIDTGYGTLAWKLRQDPRVRVLERTNALHLSLLPESPHPTSDISHPTSFDLIVIDMGWTPQRLCIPAALRWLKADGRIITLIKPHYEVMPEEKGLLHAGVLSPEDANRIALRTIEATGALGAHVVARTESPILGGKTKGNAAGNREWLALVTPASRP